MKNHNEIISGHSHSFDTGIAKHVGIEAAIVFNHIIYWLRINASKKDIEAIDGKYWMYETQKQMSDFFGYLSEDQVCRVIKKLFEAGLLIKGNYNKNKFDKTTWYTVYDQNLIVNNSIKIISPKPQGCGINPATLRNQESNVAECIYKVQEDKQEEKLLTRSSSFSHEKNQKQEASPPIVPEPKSKRAPNIFIPECLMTMPITDEQRRSIARAFPVPVIEKAVKAYHTHAHLVKDAGAWLYRACEGNYQPRSNDEDRIEENKAYSKQVQSQAIIPSNVTLEVLNKHVEIGNMASPEGMDYASYDLPNFKEALKEILKKHNIKKKLNKPGDP